MGKRRNYLDILSVLACFMVLWDHVDGSFHTYTPGKTWLLSAVIHVAVNPAVPIFVMVSGATLLDYRQRYSTRQFFKKRVISVGIPFIFWSLFYMFFWAAKGSPLPDIRSAISGILYNNSSNGHFWFFYPLFGLYLAMPIFAAIEEQTRQRIYKYCIVGYLVLSGLIPILFNLLSLKLNGAFKLEVISQFLFYALFGYYIDHYEIRKTTRYLIYFAGAAALIYNILHLTIVSTQKQAIAADYTYYTFILTAMAFFTFVRNLPDRFSEKLAKTIKPLRNVTFGVYLVQRFVLAYVTEIVNIHSVYYIAFGIIPVFTICVLLCKMIKLIPGLKHLI